jgi:hypothetical protein
MAQTTIPLDPDSPKGKQVAYELTLLLEEYEEDIARRKREAVEQAAGDAPGRAA